MADPNNLSGHTIRGYQLLERIGAGGFGAVYRALDLPPLEREVAIKVILPQYADHPDFIRRFEAEARIVARLEHSHIVPLHRYWREPGGGAYIVMRLLPTSLRKALKEDGQWSAEGTGRLLEQIASALMMAHRHGVVHRDIKPDNILLDENDNAYLADFGLAKVLEKTLNITQSGYVFGSPAYLSPEQAQAEPVTPLTDIYCLGLVVYEMLTNKQPFIGESSDISPAALIYKRLHESFPSLHRYRPDLPDALNKIIWRATALNPADRYPDAASMAADFRQVLTVLREKAAPQLPPIQVEKAPVMVSAPSPSAINHEPLSIQPTVIGPELVKDGPITDVLPKLDGEQPMGWWARSFGVVVPLVPDVQKRRLVFTRPNRAQIIFLLMIGLALGCVVIQAITGMVSLHTPLPPIEVAVNPMAYTWVSDEAQRFNDARQTINGQIIQVRVTQRDSIEVWQAGGVWTATSHPVAWIPESAFSVDYANNTGLNYRINTPSLASTSLVWGAYASRAAILGKPLDWPMFQQAVVKQSWQALEGSAAWGFVKPAFACPGKNTAGFAVLLAAAAHYHQTGQLTTQQLNDPQFQGWLHPIIDGVPSFPQLGQEPAAVLAQSGASMADFALLPESEWLKHYSRIAAREPIQFAYPAYKLVFDMPIAMWSGPETSAAELEAVQQFAAYLTQQAAQERVIAHGLRPATITSDSTNTPLFTAAQGAGLTLDPPSATPIAVPPRSAVLALLSWVKTVRAC